MWTCNMVYNIPQQMQGYTMAVNMLKLTEWAHATWQAFIGTIIDELTGQTLEYCHLRLCLCSTENSKQIFF